MRSGADECNRFGATDDARANNDAYTPHMATRQYHEEDTTITDALRAATNTSMAGVVSREDSPTYTSRMCQVGEANGGTPVYAAAPLVVGRTVGDASVAYAMRAPSAMSMAGALSLGDKPPASPRTNHYARTRGVVWPTGISEELGMTNLARPD